MIDFDGLIDIFTLALCCYVISIGIGRLAMMSWRTHRRTWQIIYALLVFAAAGFVSVFADGRAHNHIFPFCAFLAAALWFHESRDRWKNHAPPYMAINCPLPEDQIPPDCPLRPGDEA
jgi:hypothetical protein